MDSLLFPARFSRTQHVLLTLSLFLALAAAGSVVHAATGVAQPGTIHFYAEKGDLVRVRQLIHADRTLREQRQSYLGTPLAVAAANGRLDVVRFLIAAGANVNARCSDIYDSQTVLMAACGGTPYPEATRLAIVKLLVNSNALVRVVDRSGYTALHTACYWGHADVVNYLVAKGADLMALDEDGRTPFTEAMRGASMWNDWMLLRFIRVAIDQGANVNARTANHDTMLHLAAKAGHINVAAYLIVQGAEMNARDRLARTPLTLAIQRKNDAVADLLRQHGATE